MGTLTALILATPLFGLSLTPPSLEALPMSVAPVSANLSLADDEASAKVSLADDQVSAKTAAEAEEAAPKGPTLDKDTYRLQLKKRAKLTKIHRTLGITTWALTGLAVIAGTIQWRNLYAGKKPEDTPCVQGNAWLGQGQCWGTPWFHALTGFAAGAAYFSTLGVAIAMPDPDHASKGDSAYAKTLRTHKILRWVHLSGMVAQMVLGVVMANPKLSGDNLDRASNYSALRALSIVHMTTGWVTLGALSWAGTIMLI